MLVNNSPTLRCATGDLTGHSYHRCASMRKVCPEEVALPTRKRLLMTGAVVVTVLAGGLLATTAVNATIREGHPDAEEHESIVSNRFAATGSCGVERWSVKTGTDADRAKITLQSTTPTTIAALTGLTAPGTLPADNRVAPTEDTVYQLHATLTQYKLEADSDYHLVLSDGSGHTMIAEIPDPACVGSTSPLLTSIQKSRSEFDARYTPTTSFQTANVPVTITGVGFFDFLHGQTGVAPNGIELHAVLDVQFTSGGGCAGSGQLLGNPGFETGTPAPWTASSGVVSSSSGEPAHGGTWKGWLDGYGSTHTDTLAQNVTLPAGCVSYRLSFWLHVDTAETTSTSRYDTLTVQVLNSAGTVLATLATYSNLDHNTGYTQRTFSVAGYAGQQITVRFTGAEDYTAQTSFVIDDTAVTVS